MEEELELVFIKEIEDFRKSKSFQLYRKLRSYRLNLYPLRHNYIHLSKSFQEFHSKALTSSFWSNSTPNFRWNVQKKIVINILNYFSSVSAVIDISRKLASKDLSSLELEKYNQITTNTFVNNVEFKVLRKMRNYILHNSLLDVGVYIGCGLEYGVSKYTFLFSEKLSTWKNWNDKEKEYLKLKGDKLNIEPIINQYHQKLIETQDILFLKVIKQYEGEIKDLIYKVDNLQKLGIKLNMMHNLPVRKGTVRYLNFILSKSK